ncbi:MAG TPA: glutamate dehydrogenase [Terriglobia bacterium]|nr:glutamate dehydrogenase [Terriglobia bacterium]
MKIQEIISCDIRHTLRVTGKPTSLGGSLGRNEAIERDVFYTIQGADDYLKLPLTGARVVVQGFGNAGSIAAQLGQNAGAIVIAVGDSRGCVYHGNSLDVGKLIDHKEKTGNVIGFPGAEEIPPSELLALKCDILIPAALENAIDEENAAAIKAKIVAEAANGPAIPHGDRVLESKGIFVIPDILCNSGRVIVSYFEWVQDEQHLFWEAQDVYNRLERVMKTSFAEVLKIHLEHKVSMRTAANMLGIGRVAEATKLRGLYP